MNINLLKKCIENKIPLSWNDPDLIKDNDYQITYIEPIQNDWDEFTPILIQYGEGSEAQVYYHEILFDDKKADLIKTAEYLYYLKNPESKSDVPSFAYEVVEKWHKEWLNDKKGRTLYDWILSNKSLK